MHGGTIHRVAGAQPDAGRRRGTHRLRAHGYGGAAPKAHELARADGDTLQDAIALREGDGGLDRRKPERKDEPATRRQLRAPGRRDVVRTDRENDAVEWRGLDTTRPAIDTDDPDTGDARRGQVGSGPGHDVLVEVERGHRPPSPTARASSAAL